jgi:metal-responsive CopG/Arc/MetJ family transcriptional regulator
MCAVSITITLPEKIVNKIDAERGDINRSKYILRLLEHAYNLDSDSHRSSTRASLTTEDAEEGGYKRDDV